VFIDRHSLLAFHKKRTPRETKPRNQHNNNTESQTAIMSLDTTMMPTLPPGATRKRNVFDVLEELNKNTKADGDSASNAKTVLIRVDFNVPMDYSTGRITDDSRIRGALPTIQAVLKAGHNAVLVSHMGRPKLVQK
jgi:hypothetical protein